MLEIWELIIHRPVDEDQDFFLELGGDSLKAMELVDAIQDEFGVDIDVGDLFENPTPQLMCSSVSARHKSARNDS